MPVFLLDSQLSTLEEPDPITECVMTVDIECSPGTIVDGIIAGGAIWKCLPTPRQQELQAGMIASFISRYSDLKTVI
jgi:hypothetical protein